MASSQTTHLSGRALSNAEKRDALRVDGWRQSTRFGPNRSVERWHHDEHTHLPSGITLHLAWLRHQHAQEVARARQ